MKNVICLLAVALTVSFNAYALDVFKANNTDALNLDSSWQSGAAPGGTDVARFDSTSGGNSNLAVNENMTFGNFLFDGNIASDITISGTGVLTFNNEHIAYVYGKNVTINNNIFMNSSNNWSTFDVRAGASLTISGTMQKAAGAANQTLQFQGNGAAAGTLNVTGLITDFTGFRLNNGGILNLSGTMKQIGSSIYTNTGATKSTINLTGDGRFENTGWLAYSGGGFQFTSEWNMSGNSQVAATNLQLGDNKDNSQITFNQNGGTVSLSAGTLQLYANAAGATADYNLSGGTLNLREIRVSANSVFKFNGGTLMLGNGGTELFKQVGAGNAGKVIVSAGGAIIDTNGKVTTADAANALPLEHDTALGAGVKDGGLKVIGGGALFLTKANTYDGGTVIENAVLDVGANATLGVGNVTVGNNGTLNLWNSAAIDSAATLTFGSNASITLGYSGTLTVAGLYDAVADRWLDANDYSAASLSAYGFSGIGTLTVIPEPSAWLLIVSGIGALAVTRKRRG